MTINDKLSPSHLGGVPPPVLIADAVVQVEDSKSMKCDCINKIDNKLRDKNLRLVGYAHVMPDFSIIPKLETEWIDPDRAPKGQKRNPPSMFASHCPFCGEPVESRSKL